METSNSYALVLDDGSTMMSGSVSELVDSVVADHADSDAEGQLELRSAHLAAVAELTQAVLNASHDLEGLDEDALTALFHDRGSDVVQFNEWGMDIPLILDATAYQPFTDVPKPTGERLIFTDPSTELTFLESLARIGVVEFLTNE